MLIYATIDILHKIPTRKQVRHTHYGNADV